MVFVKEGVVKVLPVSTKSPATASSNQRICPSLAVAEIVAVPDSQIVAFTLDTI